MQERMKIQRNNRGFSLAEILVAMAILVVVMSGVMALYSGAVSTVRQGYQAMDAFETARSSMAVLDRDLQSAFTARELGQYYQFFGMPDGFSFVGLLGNSQLGRITYVLSPDPPQETAFETVFADSFENALHMALQSLAGDVVQLRVLLDYWVTTQDAVTSLHVQAFEAQWTKMLEENDGEIPWPLKDALKLDDRDLAETTLELPVVVTTASLLRFEEQNYTDLDTFSLPGQAGSVSWPVIDSQDPDKDNDLYEFENNTPLYDDVLDAIAPGGTEDLRDYLFSRFDYEGSDFMSPLRFITPDTVRVLLKLKQREIWVDMLAESPEQPRLPWLGPFWDNGNGPRRADYTLARNILHQIWLVDKPYPNFPDIELQHRPAAFSYGVAEGSTPDDAITRDSFNALSNIPGYELWREDFPLGPPDSEQALMEWDALLGQKHTGALRPEEVAGSPFAPRIPAFVEVGFWIMMEKAGTRGTDFRRWFVQRIDIPAGQTRGLPSSLIASPGLGG